MKPAYSPDTFAHTGFDTIMSEVPWVQRTEAQKECFQSGIPMDYIYGSGRGVRTYSSVPYTPTVQAVLNFLNHYGEYNVCFLNLYEDKKQHLGWHADDSPSMDHNHAIAVVSFGEPPVHLVASERHEGRGP